MSSWRDSTSPQAQADLDALLNAALGFAQQQLASHGEFYPYAAAIRADGQAEMIAGRPNAAREHPAAADIMASCVAELISRQHTLRATAIIVDVYLPDPGSDAIEISLEHAEGQALCIHLPYAMQRKEISYGPIRASAGARRIWAHS